MKTFPCALVNLVQAKLGAQAKHSKSMIKYKEHGHFCQMQMQDYPLDITGL